jgi:hypothetical protein
MHMLHPRSGPADADGLQWLSLAEEELRTARVAQAQAQLAHQAALQCQEALRRLLTCYATMCNAEVLDHHRLWARGLHAEQCVAGAAFALRELEACNVLAMQAAATTAAALRLNGIHRTPWHAASNDWGPVMGTVRQAARAVRDVCRTRAEQVATSVANDASVLARATSSMHRLQTALGGPAAAPAPVGHAPCAIETPPSQ